MLNTKMRKYAVKDDEVKMKSGYTQLAVENHPVAVTLAKIGDKLVVDPSLEEEQIMDARLTITTGKDGKVCAVQKGGYGYFTKEQILEAAKTAKEKAEELRKLVVKE